MVYKDAKGVKIIYRLVLEGFMLLVCVLCAWEVLQELAGPLMGLFSARGSVERADVWKKFSRWWAIDILVVATQAIVLLVYLL